MTTKAELEEAYGHLSEMFNNVSDELRVHQGLSKTLQSKVIELENQLQRVAQEKADVLTEVNGAAADLEKATKQLDIFVRRFNGVDHEMSRIREELARLES